MYEILLKRKLIQNNVNQGEIFLICSTHFLNLEQVQTIE